MKSNKEEDVEGSPVLKCPCCNDGSDVWYPTHRISNEEDINGLIGRNVSEFFAEKAPESAPKFQRQLYG